MLTIPNLLDNTSSVIALSALKASRREGRKIIDKADVLRERKIADLVFRIADERAMRDVRVLRLMDEQHRIERANGLSENQTYLTNDPDIPDDWQAVTDKISQIFNEISVVVFEEFNEPYMAEMLRKNGPEFIDILDPARFPERASSNVIQFRRAA